MTTERPTGSPASDAAMRMAAQQIISQFGGIRPMANKLGVAVSTVQGWRERGSIPAGHHAEILAAAKQHGVEIDPAELAASDRATPPPAGADAEPAESKERAHPKTKRPPKVERQPGAVNAWLGGFVLGVVVLALGAGGAVVARDAWMPLVDPEHGLADGADLMGIERRVAALESSSGAGGADSGALEGIDERIAALEARLGEAGDTAAAVSALEQRIGTMASGPGDPQQAERLAELAARIDKLDALEERVEELATLEERIEAQVGARAGAQAALTGETALMLAVLQLRDAVRDSGPFTAELDMLRRLASSGALEDGGALNELIAPLDPYAATGAPTLARLKAEFPPVARAVVMSARGGEDEGWVSGVLRRVSGLVTVRPVGPVEGQGPGAVVARAEAHLASDDLAAALGELDALGGAAAGAVQAWRDKARARLAARQVLTGLGEMLIARLKPAGG